MNCLLRHTAVLALLLSSPSIVQSETETVNIVSKLPTAGTLDTSLRNEAAAAVDRGLDWLAANQKPDGSWSNGDFPALTALALWTFARAEHPRKDEVVEAAVQFILTCVQTNGGIYKEVPGRKGGGLSNYNTAICMTALHATGRPDVTRVVQQARTFVAGSQYMGDDEYRGGFGYDNSTQRTYTDLLNTYYSAQAMHATASVEETRPAGEARADINWNETVRYISRMQSDANADPENAGGVFYNPADPKAGTSTNADGVVVFRAYGSITYAGLLALVFADVSREDVRVRSALKWAERHWTLEENPGLGQDGLFFFFHTMSRALDATGIDLVTRTDGNALNWRDAMARRLIAMQRIDPAGGAGYWLNDTGRYWENDPVLSTAYCLLALDSILD
ncbi:MAG: terpene cyclase/mutase family protein [Verrucomicrobia bacterium]|nr:terpene cyclase/mutase family protein [Verrucomicrobiota bacterium]